MNTPAHLIVSALVLGRDRWQPHWLAITSGAFVPDLPMIVFFVYERFVLGTSQGIIWSVRYFDPEWQTFFDVFNSLPFIAVGCAIAWRLQSTRWLAFLSSMAVHCLADLPLHREDAHGHFFPLTDWRFESPVSYWDPQHYGLPVMGAEILLVVLGAATLVRYYQPPAWRVIGLVVLVTYLIPLALGVSFYLAG